MRTRLYAACGCLLLCLLFPLGRRSKLAGAESGATLNVHLNYTGSGTVDERHRILVAVWDGPDFTQGGNVIPMAEKMASSKTATVTFTDIEKRPVYVTAAYDPSGSWDGHSAPPSGSSLGLYSKTPGKPEPVDIAPGKTATIEITFNDSVKMP